MLDQHVAISVRETLGQNDPGYTPFFKGLLGVAGVIVWHFSQRPRGLRVAVSMSNRAAIP
jgi:hypothetical protein